MDPSLADVFTTKPSRTNFLVLDLCHPATGTDAADTIEKPEIPVRLQKCNAINAAEVVANSDPLARARIVSIEANSSVSALNISHELMTCIFDQYKVEDEFWDVARCFGAAPHAAEAGSTHAFVRRRPDGSRVCCYDAQYVELNGRKGKITNPWSHRHTGIYYKRTVDASGQAFDLIIILHPTMGTKFAERILGMAPQNKSNGPDEPDRELARTLYEDPASIHELLLTSVLRNWREYLRVKGEQFSNNIDELFTIDGDIQEVEEELLGFEAVQKVRYLRDQILTATSFCRGSKSIIELLQRTYPESGFQENLETIQERVRGYLSGLDSLQSRIENLISLLEHSLELKHQALAKTSNIQMKELTTHTLELAQVTVKDSATVRTITFLGLLFLPGTFLSGLFGMNVFNFDSDSQNMVVAKNLYWYVVLWIIFTGVTYAIYRLVKARQSGPGLPKPVTASPPRKGYLKWYRNMKPRLQGWRKMSFSSGVPSLDEKNLGRTP